jgi:membrane fusion protein, copper/silver efflux system
MRTCFENIKLIRNRYRLVLIAVFIVGLFSCNSKEKKHDVHKQTTETKNNNTHQHDTSERMADAKKDDMNDMNSDTGNHSSRNSMEGMQMNEGVTTDTAGSETYWNALPTNRTVISTQKAIEPVESDMDFAFKGNGYISFDWRRNHKVPVRIGGRIERLYVKYNYQYVRKGEKILELYSPEINTYIEELLYVNRTNDTILQNKATS